MRRYALSYAPNTETTNIIYPNFRWSNASSKTLTLIGVQEFGDDTTQYSLPYVSFTYGDNMHVTGVNNGEGGQVQMTYERWTYFDDINKDLRSLKTTFGDPNQECYNGGAIPTSWARVGTTGTVRCDASSLLQVGTTTNVYSVAERPLPEHMVKPGGRYLFFINVRAQINTTTTNWGMRDTSTGQVQMLYSTNYPPTPITTTGGGYQDSLEMPATYNPSTTKLRIECGRCFFRSIEFIQYPLMFRVTQRTVTVQPTGIVSTYTYGYDNGAPNSEDNSAVANGTLYTKKLREFRGHAMTQVVNPEGLATVNWFYQTDSLKGRAYDTFVLKRDVFETLNSTDTDWTQSGGSLWFEGLYNIDFDSAAHLVNSAGSWASYTRTPSLTSGEIAVAHVRLTGTSAQGEVGLSSGGQFLGVTLSSTAVASNGTTLLSSGNMLKNEWYGVMVIVDAINGSRIRIWQLDNPANFGETVVTGVGAGTWSFLGRVKTGEIWLDSYFEGTPYSETITRYNTAVQYDATAVNNLIPSSTVFQDLQVVWNKVTSVEQRQYNGDAMFVGTKQEFLEYDTYGNVVRQQESAYNSGVWTPYRGSKTEYTTPNTVANIVNLPGRQVTLDCTGGACDFTTLSNKVAETYVFYDNNASYTARPTKGELTRQRQWVKESDYSQMDITYYANGNPKDQIAYTGYATASANPTTGSTQTTTTEYNDGGYNTYATKVTNELEQFTQTGYDFSLGLPTSVTDANNVVAQAAYDKFGRMTKVAAAGDSLDAPTLAIEYIKYNSGTNQPFQINLTQRVSDTGTIQLSRFYDGAGRQIQTQTVNMLVNDTRKNVVVDYQYNSVGKLIKQSIPWARTNGTPVFFTQDFSQSTATTFDVIGRMLSITQPNANQTLYAYTDITTTVTDPKLQSTTKTMDTWGRTVRVDSPTGPAIGYIYDVKGQLLKAIRGTSVQVDSCLTNPTINCPDNKTVSIVYDSGGRKLSMTDPDMGHWVYEYDAIGNLKFQIDNRMCEASLNYDSLNRLISKSSAGINCVNQIATSYFYDNDNPDTPSVYDPPVTGNTQVGRRTAMYDNSGSTTWVYDNRGRLTAETKIITGAASPFLTQWTEYNSADLPVKMVYPDGEELTYSYNSDGTLDSVTSSTGGTYLAGTTYDEVRHIKSMEYGQGVIRKAFTYFPFNTTVQGGLLETSIATRLSDSSTLQDFSYTYDKNANVLTIVDNLAGPQTQTFDYDSLNRLIGATATGGTDGLYSESYEYDADTGNLSVKAATSYTYSADHPHAVASLSNGNSYDYDANGNMIQRVVDAKTFDIAYDAENRLMGVTAQNVEGLSAFSGNPPVYESVDNAIAPDLVDGLADSVPDVVLPDVPSQKTTTPTSVPTMTATPIPTDILPTIDLSVKTATPTPTETLVPIDSQEQESDSIPLEENTTGSDVESTAPEQAAAALASVSYYVNIVTGNNSNACTSPAAPCKNIQETINKAASGDIIYVASGRYLFSVNGSPNVVIINGKNLTLSGGWNADFSAQTGASTIDGANANNGILLISGTVVVENFIVENSTSSNSGAIYIVNGNLTVQRSTLRNNVATNNGAGIFVDNGIVSIINSTISGNRATNGGGGIYASLKSGASVTIQNSTIAYNQAATGGGIYRATNGTYVITNTIIANNTGTTASPDCSGTIDTANFNVIENTIGCTITNGGNNFYVDPQISSTSSGTMLVYQPLAGSPVINTGTFTGCPTIDQQGTTRPQGSSCDIGAVEATANMPQLGLQISSNPSSYTTAGQTISYTYTLTNTGNVPLTAPYTVSDNKAASVNCSAATSPLAAGSSTTCVGSYTVAQGDVAAGSIQNSASATASYSSTTITSNVATATVTVPKLRLQMSAVPGNFTEAGQVIQYTYTLTNTGSVPLNGPYVVTDSKVTSVDCSAATSPLAAGSSTTCIGSYIVTADDVTAGSIVSSASATASDGVNTITSNTIIATISASTGTSILSDVAFTYNGEGQRVKSVMHDVGGIITSTTYFAGSYYELADDVITKYYYAGAQQIAIRKGGMLSYVLGDHLGSTSVITDDLGVTISEIKYTAWGEVRFEAGVTPSAYTYTGQYSYVSDFGLMFYNARWYDSSLGRFAQPDILVPGMGDSQAWDRYSYSSNNPVKYADPSGHWPSPTDLLNKAFYAIVDFSTNYVRPAYEMLDSIAKDYPVVVDVANVVVDTINAGAKSNINTDPKTATWGDLTKMWFYEQGKEKMSFVEGDYTTNSLMNQSELAGIRELAASYADKGIYDSEDWSKEDQGKLWIDMNSKSKLTNALLTANTAPLFLGSYGVQNVNTKPLGNGSYSMNFNVVNESGWESATRLVRNGAGRGGSGIFDNVYRGEGIHWGGNFFQQWRWSEVYNPYGGSSYTRYRHIR